MKEHGSWQLHHRSTFVASNNTTQGCWISLPSATANFWILQRSLLLVAGDVKLQVFQLRVAAIRRSRVLAGIVPDSGSSIPLLGHIRKYAQA